VKQVFEAGGGGRLTGEGLSMRCIFGGGGLVPAHRKREGDGATPLGTWPMRRVFYRPDRMAAPVTALPLVPLAAHDGWCDAPGDALYNRPVSLPYPASHECLWRDDAIYDLIVELGYNDDPVIAGRGSAIFLHIARDDFSPTEGCVAVARAELGALLAQARPGAALRISL